MFPDATDWSRIARLQAPAGKDAVTLAWFALHRRDTPTLLLLIPDIQDPVLRNFFIGVLHVYDIDRPAARKALLYAKEQTSDDRLGGWIGYYLGIADYLCNDLQPESIAEYGMARGGLGNLGRARQLEGFAHAAKERYDRQIVSMKAACDILKKDDLGQDVWLERTFRALAPVCYETGVDMDYCFDKLPGIKQCDIAARIEILRHIGKMAWLRGDATMAQQLLSEAHSLCFFNAEPALIVRVMADLSMLCQSLGESVAASGYASAAKLASTGFTHDHVWDDPSTWMAGLTGGDIDLGSHALSALSKDRRVEFNTTLILGSNAGSADQLESAYDYFSGVGYQYRSLWASLELFRLTRKRDWSDKVQKHMKVYGEQCVFKKIFRTMPAPGLSAREASVWKWMLRGLSMNDIAIRDNVSKSTVIRAATRIYEVTECTCREEFMRKFNDPGK